MIVEICGSPGAGKSTALPILSELLRERGHRVRVAAAAVEDRLAESRTVAIVDALRGPAGARDGRARRFLVDLPWGLLGAVTAPRLTATALVAIARSPVGRRHRALLVQRFLVPLAHRRFLSNRVSVTEAVLFDEGLVHRAVNIFAWRSDGLPRDELKRYADRVPAPDVLVVVTAPPAVARARLEGRGLPRNLRGRTHGEITAFLQRADEALDVVIDAMHERTTVVSVSNDASIDALRARLATGLDEAASRGAPRRLARGAEFVPTLRVALRRPDRSRNAERPGRAEEQGLDLILEAYGLRRVGTGRRVGRGRSRNLVVGTEIGDVFVKRYKPSVSGEAIACEHAVLTELARREVPAPRLVQTRHGTTSVAHGGHHFALFEAIEGYVAAHERVAWPGEPSRIARLAGEALGQLHLALDGFWPEVLSPIGVDRAGARIQPTAWYRAELARAVPHLPTDLRGAASWVEQRLCALGNEIESAMPEITVIHGDYGPYNLLLRPGRAVLPIDFELARPDWRALDLATAIPRFAASRLRFDTRRARIFLAGYGTRAGMVSPTELRLVPRVAEYVALRRLVVCSARSNGAGGSPMLDEARARLREARELARGTHGLCHVVR